MKLSNKNYPAEYGFTLIELLVVISIIGLLASILLVALNNVRENARIAKTKASMKETVKAIELARDKNNKPLAQIVGFNYSLGSFGCTGIDLRKPLNGCYNQYIAYWQMLGVNSVPMDGWGSPLLVDENEYQSGSTSCIQDELYSAGPNGIFEGGAGDDYHISIPFFICSSSIGSNPQDSF